jgi:hypothetical protein
MEVINSYSIAFGKPRLLKNLCVRVSTGFPWLITGTGGGLCEHGSESSGSMKGGEFLDQLSD